VRFDTILWASDGSLSSENALAMAELLALKYGSRIVAVTVAEQHPYDDIELVRELKDELQRVERRLLEMSRERVEERVNSLNYKGIKCAVSVESGDPAEIILDVARRERADLIALGVQGVELEQEKDETHVLGGNAATVLREAECPVLLAPHGPRGRARIERVLVPTDFSEPAASSLVHALDICSRFGAKLVLLHVLSYHSSFDVVSEHLVQTMVEQTESQLRNLLDKVSSRGPGGLEMETRCVVSSRDWLGIVRFAEELDADLMVMATYGRKGLARFLMGSVTEKVVARASCPVLCIKPARPGD